MFGWTRSLALASLMVVFVPRTAAAADTVETWAVGATNLDIYFGLAGLRAPRATRTIYADIMPGFGLVPGLSAYLGMTLEANHQVSDGQLSAYVGLFGTVLDSDHVDFDLFVDFRVQGPGLADFRLTPSFELNLDYEPELAAWGVYLRAAFPIHGHPGDPVLPEADRAAVQVELNPGIYVTVAEGHQVLIEYDMSLHGHPDGDERGVGVGGVALGYNFAISDAIESINEFYVDIPQAQEKVSFALVSGIIITMPGARVPRTSED